MQFDDTNKVIYILRAVSGAGKSSLANHIKFLYPDAVICSADDFHIKNGEYKFIPENIGKCNNWCFDKFQEAIQEDKKVIIVANTNAHFEQEAKKYFEFGRSNNYTVFSLIIENRNNTSNIHNVPEISLDRQEQKLKQTIKLR